MAKQVSRKSGATITTVPTKPAPDPADTLTERMAAIPEVAEQLAVLRSEKAATAERIARQEAAQALKDREFRPGASSRGVLILNPAASLREVIAAAQDLADLHVYSAQNWVGTNPGNNVTADDVATVLSAGAEDVAEMLRLILVKLDESSNSAAE